MDNQNLFQIEADEGKEKVFMSAVAQRFRDFKSKLVSTWITKKIKRGIGATKSKSNNGEEGEGDTNENVDPTEMPWDIYPHVTKDDWEKFVALKTTPEEIVSTSIYLNFFYFFKSILFC